MSRLHWHCLVLMVLMWSGAAMSLLGRPTEHLADKIGKPDLQTIFPADFAGWQTDLDIPMVLPSPDVQAQLNAIYNQVISRTYVNAAGQRIMLSVAYGGDQSDGTSAHRPEACYPAQGFEITSNRQTTISAASGELSVRRLMSSLGARKEPITYWLVVGDEVVTTGVGQKLAQMSYGLRGVIADGMLVRVSSIDADVARGHALQAKFIAELAASLPAAQQRRVFGRPPL